MTEYTLAGWKASLLGFLFIFPVVVLYVFPYLIIWYRDTEIANLLPAVVKRNRTAFVAVIEAKWLCAMLLAMSIVLHELIHGVCMAIGASKGWKSVSFGFNMKSLTPYAHCKEPLTPATYRTSLLMPALLLGEIPVFVGWCTGNALWLLYGILMLWAAGGDCIILFMSRKIKSNVTIQDHPDKIGFIAVTDESTVMIG
ncbi:MAG: DUF3267 domain-containing protein [Bacteroidales bacterium]|jgi:hypothetical protein|nr:DUF3267 domain-containing protein [Bacteroidales bacterium]